ncbi:MAG: hypothetical protein H7196_00945, partial [candidate division SR1 bacterium]|nr:hypothetical protein [candidate division SR1 bacterium]
GVTNEEYRQTNNFKKENPNLIDQKWLQHRFGCVGNNTGNCGFDTGSKKANLPSNLKNMIGLTTSDSVAAYNIAKRGLEFITKSNN